MIYRQMVIRLRLVLKLQTLDPAAWGAGSSDGIHASDPVRA